MPAALYKKAACKPIEYIKWKADEPRVWTLLTSSPPQVKERRPFQGGFEGIHATTWHLVGAMVACTERWHLKRSSKSKIGSGGSERTRHRWLRVPLASSINVFVCFRCGQFRCLDSEVQPYPYVFWCFLMRAREHDVQDQEVWQNWLKCNASFSCSYRVCIDTVIRCRSSEHYLLLLHTFHLQKHCSQAEAILSILQQVGGRLSCFESSTIFPSICLEGCPGYSWYQWYCNSWVPIAADSARTEVAAHFGCCLWRSSPGLQQSMAPMVGRLD